MFSNDMGDKQLETITVDHMCQQLSREMILSDGEVSLSEAFDLILLQSYTWIDDIEIV